ncbi:MAG TPA: acetolactate synthase small subunit [Fulvivirga sp.]|nr:acetolactate synthase small subunit [Fulvivirga sp.]
METNNKYSLSVFTENHLAILQRVLIILNRRRVNIESLHSSESEVSGVHRLTVIIRSTEETAIKLVKQIDKQVEVIRAFHHLEDDTVFQEIALYKVPSNAVVNGINIGSLIRDNYARILAIESDFMITEKTGHQEETHDFMKKLEPYGILEFARSGRVSLTKQLAQMSALN